MNVLFNFPNNKKMSEKLKIKLSIADRMYPMSIHPDQEEGLRKASKKIEAMIKQFEQNYAVRDKQDVLAMCAVQFAAQTEQYDVNNRSEVLQAENKLKKLNDLILESLEMK